MNITYGICLGPGFNIEYVYNLLKSIMSQKSNYESEIIVIGDLHEQNFGLTLEPSSNFRSIYFDETVKPGWITKKKNIIAQEAKYDNLVIMHDYLKLADGWLNGVKAYTSLYPNWRVLMNRVENLEGTRHADWCVSPDRMQEVIDTDPERFTRMLMNVAPHENAAKFVAGLPYGVNDLSHIQYISGGFIVCKKEVLQTTPMDETLVWGTGEDVEWSNRLNLNNVRFHFNPYSVTTIQKPNKWYMSQMPYEFVEELRKYYGYT